MQIEEVINAIDILNKFEDRKNILISNLSDLDLEEQDLLHYIETEKFNAVEGYKLSKKIKEIRLERRKVKNELSLVNLFQQNANKLINVDNRRFLMTTLGKENKKLISAKYVYKKIEKEQIIGE
jgi:hypothetical protein